ncbi:MAG TPA: hypothetical protein VMB81_14285, partial [Candidatus Sulfotelmatobacter sp.]|nr:hypothetical protein [Candidatus Sulfotelmatobacter sp.]
LPSCPDAGLDAAGAIDGERTVWFAETSGSVRCPVYDRERLRAGNRFAGPAIVEQMDATTLVLPDMTARVDAHLNLILEFGAAAEGASASSYGAAADGASATPR